MSRTYGIMIVLLAVASLGASSLANRQQALWDSLDSRENGTTGLSINGVMSSGYVGSTVKSPLVDDVLSPTVDEQAYTQGDLNFTARPSRNVRARVDFRIHQDWQNAYTEGPNPFNLRWWSVGGKITGANANFRLGDFQAKGTPFTLWAVEPTLVNEPEIFRKQRKEAMQERYLKENSRPLTGLDFDWHLGKTLGMENLSLSGNLVRLRNIGKKVDQLGFDFAETDKYLASGVFGINPLKDTEIRLSYYSVFDRILSARTVQNANVPDGEIVEYENNSVLSAYWDFDLASLLKLGNIKLGLNGEYALSTYQFSYDRDAVPAGTGDNVDWAPIYHFDAEGNYVQFNGAWPTAPRAQEDRGKRERVFVNDSKGSAMFVEFQLGYEAPGRMIDVLLDAGYLQNARNFESFLAQSPTFSAANIAGQTNQIFNSSSVFAGSLYSTFDALYNTRFQVDPLTDNNAVSKWVLNNSPKFADEKFNNYRRKPFTANAYTNTVMTRRERKKIVLDPTVNTVMPYGRATPNRVGPMFNLKTEALDGIVDLNLAYALLEEKDASVGLLKNKYTDLAAGLNVHVASLLSGWDNAIDLGLGYGDAKVSHDLEVVGVSPLDGVTPLYYSKVLKVNQITGGARIGFLRRYALLAGYQAVKLSDVGIERNETITSAGLEVKLAESAALELEYGISKIDYTDTATAATVDFERALLSAVLWVMF